MADGDGDAGGRNASPPSDSAPLAMDTDEMRLQDDKLHEKVAESAVTEQDELVPSDSGAIPDAAVSTEPVTVRDTSKAEDDHAAAPTTSLEVPSSDAHEAQSSQPSSLTDADPPSETDVDFGDFTSATESPFAAADAPPSVSDLGVLASAGLSTSDAVEDPSVPDSERFGVYEPLSPLSPAPSSPPSERLSTAATDTDGGAASAAAPVKSVALFTAHARHPTLPWASTASAHAHVSRVITSAPLPAEAARTAVVVTAALLPADDPDSGEDADDGADDDEVRADLRERRRRSAAPRVATIPEGDEDPSAAPKVAGAEGEEGEFEETEGDDEDDEEVVEEEEEEPAPRRPLERDPPVDRSRFPQESVDVLTGLGFSPSLALRALARTDGDIGKASTLLAERELERRAHLARRAADAQAAEEADIVPVPRVPLPPASKGILKRESRVLTDAALQSLGIGSDISSPKSVRFALPDGSSHPAGGDEDARGVGATTGGHSGSELFSFYISTCSRRDIEPWEPLLRQMKMATNTRQRLHTIDLKGIVITRRSAEVFAEVVMNNPSLRRLSLENTQLDDETMRIIAEGLLFHNKVEWLNVSHNRRVRFHGYRALTDFMARSTCLRYLDVSGIPVDTKMAQLMAHALASPRLALVILRMQECAFKAPAFDLIARGLRQSKVVQFSPRSSGLTAAMGSILADLLLGTSSLTRLDLRNNDLRNAGVAALAEALARNRTLEHLYLWENGITGDGVIALTRGLSANTSLKQLDLSFNPCGQQRAMEALKEALIINKSVQVLKLAGTEMTAEGAVALAELLPETSRLKHLDLNHNRLGVAGIMALCVSLRLNKSVEQVDLMPSADDPNEQLLVDEVHALCERNRTGGQEQIKRTVIELQRPPQPPSEEEVRHIVDRGRASAAELGDVLRTHKAQPRGSLTANQMVQDMRREATELKQRVQGMVTRLAGDAANLPQLLQVNEALVRVNELYDMLARRDQSGSTASPSASPKPPPAQ